MTSEPLPECEPDPEKKAEILDDNARKFVVSSISPEFLKFHNATSYLLITDWLETGKDTEKKVARKVFTNGDEQLLLISKENNNGSRTSEKKKISKVQYDELLALSVHHLEKMRYEFAYTQNDKTFDMKYDEFPESNLRIVEVDASDDDSRESFVPDKFISGLREVTGNVQFYGYRVASIV